MSKKKPNYEPLIALIPEGKDNAISQKELSILLNCEERETRAIIQKAREDRVLICSVPGYRGYYLPESPEEILICYRTFLSRKKSTEKVLKTLKKYLKAEGIDPEESVKKGENHD